MNLQVADERRSAIEADYCVLDVRTRAGGPPPAVDDFYSPAQVVCQVR